MENSVAVRTATYLQDLLQDVFQAIEFGTAYCLDQFEKDKEIVQNTRLTDTVRYKTRLALQEKGYHPANLAMNGLHLTHKGYDVKIFKAGRKGEVPVAGKSKKRLQYYNHHYGQNSMDLDNIRSVIAELQLETRRELIVLYKLDALGAFRGIDLVCVEKADYPFGIPELAWRSAVEHPLMAIGKHEMYAEKPTELGNIDTAPDEVDDLEIFKDGTND